MNSMQYNEIQSEIDELNILLELIPEERVIDRESIIARIKKLNSKICNVTQEQLIKKLFLTFKGLPVVGTSAINANFAVKALDKFCEAIHTTSAGENEDKELKYKGPIPGKHNNEMMITGIALGSFGFELELPHPINKSQENESEQNDWFPPEAKTVLAITRIQEVFESAVKENDEEMSFVLNEMNRRAIKKLYDFTNYLSENGAYCNINLNKEKVFSFNSLEDLEKTNAKLNPNNIDESTITFIGYLEGELPKSRNFEFRIESDSTIIRGKISDEIENPKELNIYLEKRAQIVLSRIQIGQSRPKYTLMRLSDISFLNDDHRLL